jgi:biotin transport system substrate-specific component
MNHPTTALDTSIVARLWPQTSANAALRAAVLVLAGTALLALAARVQVPLWPVKMSMQDFVVLALGVAYGSRLGAATVLAYIAEGALGLPVFVSGSGLAYFAGPTTGYLAGFVVAAFVVGTLAERGMMRSRLGALAGFVAGYVIILSLGFAWLSTLVGFEKAFAAGVLVFLPAGAIKLALATLLMPLANRAVR